MSYVIWSWASMRFLPSVVVVVGLVDWLHDSLCCFHVWTLILRFSIWSLNFYVLFSEVLCWVSILIVSKVISVYNAINSSYAITYAEINSSLDAVLSVKSNFSDSLFCRSSYRFCRFSRASLYYDYRVSTSIFKSLFSSSESATSFYKSEICNFRLETY